MCNSPSPFPSSTPSFSDYAFLNLSIFNVTSFLHLSSFYPNFHSVIIFSRLLYPIANLPPFPSHFFFLSKLSLTLLPPPPDPQPPLLSLFSTPFCSRPISSFQRLSLSLSPSSQRYAYFIFFPHFHFTETPSNPPPPHALHHQSHLAPWPALLSVLVTPFRILPNPRILSSYVPSPLFFSHSNFHFSETPLTLYPLLIISYISSSPFLPPHPIFFFFQRLP